MTSPGPGISASRIRRGAALFAGLSLVGLLIVLYRSSLAATIAHLRAFDRDFLALAIVLFNVDWLLSGARIHIFARQVKRDIPFLASVRSCFINIFVGGITPSQTGGGPAQIYVMYREGLSVVDSTVVCFVGGFLGTAVVLMLCAITFSLFAQPQFASSGLQIFSGVSLTLFSLVVVLVLLSLASPRRFERAVLWVVGRIPRLRRLVERRGALDRTFGMVRRYHDLMTGFIVRRKLLFLAGIGLSALIYTNKFAIAWVVLRGLGLEAEFWHVMYMQVVLILIFYFSPTPGASGLAEVSTAAIMSSVVPSSYQGVFVLLWRFFTLVAGMLVGAALIFRYIYTRRAGEATAGEESGRVAEAVDS